VLPCAEIPLGRGRSDTVAANVGGEAKVIQIIPWTDLNGHNNNFLYID
jgi:aspartokinase